VYAHAEAVHTERILVGAAARRVPPRFKHRPQNVVLSPTIAGSGPERARTRPGAVRGQLNYGAQLGIPDRAGPATGKSLVWARWVVAKAGRTRGLGVGDGQSSGRPGGHQPKPPTFLADEAVTAANTFLLGSARNRLAEKTGPSRRTPVGLHRGGPGRGGRGPPMADTVDLGPSAATSTPPGRKMVWNRGTTTKDRRDRAGGALELIAEAGTQLRAHRARRWQPGLGAGGRR